jgi:hypothetical protein
MGLWKMQGGGGGAIAYPLILWFIAKLGLDAICI